MHRGSDWMKSFFYKHIPLLSPSLSLFSFLFATHLGRICTMLFGLLSRSFLRCISFCTIIRINKLTGRAFWTRWKEGEGHAMKTSVLLLHPFSHIGRAASILTRPYHNLPFNFVCPVLVGNAYSPMPLCAAARACCWSINGYICPNVYLSGCPNVCGTGWRREGIIIRKVYWARPPFSACRNGNG